VKVVRNDQVGIEDIEQLAPERILLSPGPCTPDDAGITLDVIRHFAGKLPLLGVCLGHQAMGQAFGGDVVRAPYLMHGKTSQILHDGKTISATTSDGLIMGVRHREFPACEGVQFHPESIMTTEGKKLLANFLKLS
jgi:anthranilate synthase/aminodeoxychorismate synthase-like glutamine amidotransferase